MTKEDKEKQIRVSKREYLARVSARSRIPLRTVTRVYDTAMEELMETAKRGDALMLTGFGKFYPQSHKGHRVQIFDKDTGLPKFASDIEDYRVLKFSATRNVNKALGNKPSGDRPEPLDESDPNLFSDVDDYDESEFEEEEIPKKRAPRKATASKKSVETKESATAVKITRPNRAHRLI